VHLKTKLMKTFFTKGIYMVFVTILFMAAALPAMAQYTKTVLESTQDYTAMAKDAAGNIYVTQSTSSTAAEIVKYTNGGGSPLVIFSGLSYGDDLGPGGDLPWGLAVASNGDVYCTTDFTSNNFGGNGGGNIIKLASNNGTSGTIYTPSIYQSQGAFYTALAFDSSDNLYVTQFDPTGNVGNDGGSYAIFEYTKGTAANTGGVNIYDKLTSSSGYSYPTGLAVASNLDIYVTNPYDEDGSVVDGGQVLKLTKASNYAFASRVILSSGQNCSALALDGSGNLYTEENTATAPSGYKLFEYPGGSGPAVTLFSSEDSFEVFYPFGIAPISAEKIFLNDGENSSNGAAVWELQAANADLASLTISSGTLTPGFASGTTAYTDAVTNATTTVTVTPTFSDPNATQITVNTVGVTSGTASQNINLSVGTNPIAVKVTAFDGVTTKTYNITVTRAASSVATLSNMVVMRLKNGNPSTAILNPAFSSGDFSYSIDAPNSTSQVTITPTVTDATATVKVNGTTVASGTASGNIALNVGANTITTVVTAQDGTTKDTYTLGIDRRNSLGQLNGLYEPISVNQTPGPQLGEDIVVHPALSPNGDGINDVFTIDGLQAYPDNKITIMNRDGVVIYQVAGYDNSTKVFDGHSNISGKLQEAGTYFYTLEYNAAGINKHKTGYVILKY
jgi:gliding motility-associated-like protein